MPRYGDLDALIDSFWYYRLGLYGVRREAVEKIVEYIYAAPTVDVAPAVRCKKCQHFRESKAEHVRSYCPKTNLFFGSSGIDPETFYCKVGEKSE